MAKKKKGKKKTVRSPRSAVRKKKKSKKGKNLNVAYLGLGSNVGDREEYIEQAVFLLEKDPAVTVTRRSGNYETEAEGEGSQPPFINAAVETRTRLSPHKLLELCDEIELALGREREMRWAPRTIDIDILFYNSEIVSDDKLQVPHPLVHERLFVLKPLREIAPHFVHPVLEKSIDALYAERKGELGEKYDDELPGFKEIKGGAYDDYERW